MLRHMFSVAVSRGVAQRATKLSYAWIWLWLVVGNTSSGKKLYQQLASFLVEDTKGGLPLVTLALPILGSAVISTILVQGRQRSSPPAVDGTSKGGDPSFDVYAVWMLLVPLTCYALSSIFGRWTAPSGLDDKLSGTANSFGLTALVALSLGLIPVARHSILLRSMGWNPVAAIRLHVWSGRIVVVGSLLHGGLHVWRFQRLEYNLLEAFLPPPECRVWYQSEHVEITGCSGITEEDCSCYSRWRNFTGAVGLAALLVVGLSTLHVVRRRWYTAFYRIHVLAGPLVLVAVLLHWSRSILYLSAGLVYYLASSLALRLEHHQHVDDPVEIVNVRHLPAVDSRGCPCVSLTVAATDSAIAQFQAGQYVKLHVPSLSSVAHPFTVNRVLNSEGGDGSDCPPRLRIVFRVQGPFTRQLANQLLRGPSHRPDVCLDGYHGIGRLSHALRHDWVMVVAGGIGITPYLSLLPDLLRATAVTPYSDNDDNKPKLRRVVVHWVCRDPSLVDYVQSEYLDPLVTAAPSSPGSSCTLHICIHHTRDRSTLPSTPESCTGCSGEHSPRDAKDTPRRPFEPSHHGIPPFVGTVVASLAALWPLYVVVRSHPASVLPRLLAPLAALLLLVVVAGVIAARRQSTRDGEPATNAPPHWKRWRGYQSLSSSDDDTLEGPLDLGDVAAGTSPGPVDGSLVPDGAEPRVRLEHRDGRPSLRGLLSEALLLSSSSSSSSSSSNLVNSSSSGGGLFVCGPPALGRGLRQAILREARQRQPPVAMYEESFEL